MATRYRFTFTFKDAARVLNNDEAYVSVFATRYDRAVKKVIKLELPNVTEQDLVFAGCDEEDIQEEEVEIPSAN